MIIQNRIHQMLRCVIFFPLLFLGQVKTENKVQTLQEIALFAEYAISCIVIKERNSRFKLQQPKCHTGRRYEGNYSSVIPTQTLLKQITMIAVNTSSSPLVPL